MVHQDLRCVTVTGSRRLTGELGFTQPLKEKFVLLSIFILFVFAWSWGRKVWALGKSRDCESADTTLLRRVALHGHGFAVSSTHL